MFRRGAVHENDMEIAAGAKKKKKCAARLVGTKLRISLLQIFENALLVADMLLL